MDPQALFNALLEGARQTRSEYHLTLGKFIDALDANPDVDVVFDFDESAGVGREGSYRGYYSDLALATGPVSKARKVARKMKAAAGSTYQGYKGGDFNMGFETPLWCAEYGCGGRAIIGAKLIDKKLVLQTKGDWPLPPTRGQSFPD